MAIVVLSAVSCSGLKEVSSLDPLLVENVVEFEDPNNRSKRADLNLGPSLNPRPNRQILWMRLGLARYTMLSDSARTRKFWKKWSSPPVLLSSSNPSSVVRSLSNTLFHAGYFRSDVRYDTIRQGKKRASLKYTIKLNPVFKIGTVTFPEQEGELFASIRASQENTLLRTGRVYALETIKNERKRIDRFLKENGYVNFNSDFLLIEVDSVSNSNTANLKVVVKPETPPESKRIYSVNDIFIHDDFSLNNYRPDTLHFGRYHLISRRKSLNFDMFKRGISFQPDQLYTHSNYFNSINYFEKIPLFQNISFKLKPTSYADRLDADIYLTQRSRYSVTTEFDFTTRSTNYFGPGLLASFTDRNLGRGGEQLKVNLTGRFEVQLADGQVNPAYQLGLDFNLSLPQLYPGFLERRNVGKNAKTNISVGYNLFDRLDLYRLNSFFINYGYQWTHKKKTSHRFRLIEIIYSQVPEDSKTEAFQEYLRQNPGVARTFEEQFVVGTGYDIDYQTRFNRVHSIALSFGIDLSGNLLRGILSGTGAKQDSLGRYRVLGLPFSQYVRTRMSAAYGYDLNLNSSLHTRLVLGYGQPYGNSDVMPYIKQFFVGGTNSLRSFVARSVGPGSEVPPEGFRDLTGDIHLEWNLEYRFSFSGSFKGALFTDAGNVWLTNEDPFRPNGTFRPSTFMKEVAVSAGWGLRWDFDFVVARLDFAYTLRTPFLPPGERWNRNINIWNPVVSIAVGYPF